MTPIPLTRSLEQLHTHLEDYPRTIISAAFGNGKSTLLTQYMERYKDVSEFIVLHPVHYSCGSNEDIFENIFTSRAAFKIGQDRFCVTVHQNGDGTSSADIQRSAGTVITQDITPYLRRCFNLAMSKVKGCS